VDDKKTVRMRISVGGSPSLSARKEYALTSSLADELITAGYADLVDGPGAAEGNRRGRPPRSPISGTQE